MRNQSSDFRIISGAAVGRGFQFEISERRGRGKRRRSQRAKGDIPGQRGAAGPIKSPFDCRLLNLSWGTEARGATSAALASFIGWLCFLAGRRTNGETSPRTVETLRVRNGTPNIRPAESKINLPDDCENSSTDQNPRLKKFARFRFFLLSCRWNFLDKPEDTFLIRFSRIWCGLCSTLVVTFHYVTFEWINK